jgi:hypothetical protein
MSALRAAPSPQAADAARLPHPLRRERLLRLLAEATLRDGKTPLRHPTPHEEALEQMNRRVKADPSLIRQRRRAAEHPFGTIKRMTAGGRFLTRGLKKVAGEAALSVLPYNIIRAIHLVGAETLRARLA